jgi:DNA-directed RNA polymerase specialized sigma24 family protein
VVAAPAAAPAAPLDPLVRLVEHQAAIAELLEVERQLIVECRGRGYSWRLIGAAAGVTPQAAEQRAKRAQRRAAAP